MFTSLPNDLREETSIDADKNTSSMDVFLVRIWNLETFQHDISLFYMILHDSFLEVGGDIIVQIHR